MSDPPDFSAAPETWLERQIRQAMEETPIHLLPGAGKPIPDLTGHDPPDWWARRFLGREQAADLERAIGAEIRTTVLRLWRFPDEAAVRSWVDSINRRIDALPRDRTAEPLDPGEVVRRWRVART